MRQKMTGFGMQWHQLDHMQTIFTSPQTDNHTNTSSLHFTDQMLFLMPNQQCQSSEGETEHYGTLIRNGATCHDVQFLSVLSYLQPQFVHVTVFSLSLGHQLITTLSLQLQLPLMF